MITHKSTSLRETSCHQCHKRVIRWYKQCFKANTSAINVLAINKSSITQIHLQETQAAQWCQMRKHTPERSAPLKWSPSSISITFEDTIFSRWLLAKSASRTQISTRRHRTRHHVMQKWGYPRKQSSEKGSPRLRNHLSVFKVECTTSSFGIP